MFTVGCEQLVIPFEPVFQHDYGYSILCQPDTSSNLDYKLFCSWLTSQVQTT
jgi:hypothetical protein